MDYADKITRDLLHELLNKLQSSTFHDILLLLVGGFIGFIGSYTIYRLSERKKLIEKFDLFLIEISGLAEEIKQNTFNIKCDLYINSYFIKLIELSENQEQTRIDNKEKINWNKSKIETRLHEHEKLSAKFRSKITGFKLVHGESSEFNLLIDNFFNYKLVKDYFDDANDLLKLKEMFSAKFTSKIEEEIKSGFEPLINSLLIYMEKKTIERKKKIKRFI